MNNRATLGLAAMLTLALGTGFLLARHAFAEGPPSKGALSYWGTLEDQDGMPAFQTGDHNVEVQFFAVAMDGTPVCDTGKAQPLKVDAHGRFSLSLPDQCAVQVAASPDLWVEVFVDGASLGRAKVGAVPYALEASHAVAATTITGPQAQGVVPKGAVMFFNVASCPTGWTPFSPAQGRYVVGVPTGGTLSSTVGTALANGENRPVGQHSHDITDVEHDHGGGTAPEGDHADDVAFGYTGSGAACQGVSHATAYGCYDFWSEHNHPIAAAKTGITGTQSAGAVAGTNAPYVQLLACQKN